jgi:hypothetical protein
MDNTGNPRKNVITNVAVDKPTVSRSTDGTSNAYETVLLSAGEKGCGRRIGLDERSL